MWLSDAGEILRTYNVTKPDVPLKAYADLKSFKVFLLDVGLLRCLSGLSPKVILEGSRIFEEFKGTGNMELQLDRMLSNKRIFPSVNLVQSSTRRDDLLQDPTTLNRMWIIRKFISEMNPIEAMSTVRDRLIQTRSNEEFLLSMNG